MIGTHPWYNFNFTVTQKTKFVFCKYCTGVVYCARFVVLTGLQ